jgi:nitroimidazol reductase NimA-like FMN-containing flavoprotein (pyridoxamine 5'-phosphate oxidase superfamily)
MPSRRELIAMTAEEVRSYLESQRRTILVTNGADGMPHPVPMNYGLDEAGRFILTAFAKSQKVKNLDRDPRATLLVESGGRYHELKSVIAWCDAEIVRDPLEVRALLDTMRAAPELAASVSPAMREQVAVSMAKRVALRFTPFRVVSWDHAKLGSKY